MPNKINEVGKQYGRLKVMAENGRSLFGQVLWLCECVCGSKVSVVGYDLRSGNSSSCGCLRADTVIDETGKKYGKLTVLKRIKVSKKTREAHWFCRCECGKEKAISGKGLRTGRSTSCGRCSLPLIVEEVGYSKHYLYHTWSNMMRRCYDSNNPNFKYYGGGGIKVYKDWHNPTNFYKWIEENLGLRPEGYSLDRANVYADYEPGNLRWSDPYGQTNNRRMITLSEEEYQHIMRLRQVQVDR